MQFAVEYHADVDVESKPNQELEDEVFETVQEATEDVPSGESGEYEDVEVCDEGKFVATIQKITLGSRLWDP